MQELLSALAFFNEDDWQFAVEFRNSSWYESEVYETMEEYKTCLVFQDIPPSSSMKIERATSDVVYFRLHGPEPRYRGCYSDDF